MTRPVSVEDWRRRARARLPRVLFDYIDGGSYAETTLGWNTDAFQRLSLRQRVLVDVSEIATRVSLFGQNLSMPVILGPVGMAGLYARRGEAQAARAAEAAGLPFTLSTVGVCPVEEVAAATARPPWFQLYMIRDRGWMAALLERAKAAGAPVLVFTVDLPVPGARYRDVRTGLSGDASLAGRLRRAVDGAAHPAWLYDVWLNGRPHTFGNVAGAIPDAEGPDDFWVWIARNFDPRVTWRDLAWVRERWDGPIVLKGVLDVEDALLAATHGLDGLVVSNHGGRQLDGAAASLDALAPIVEAVGERLTVLMDGGVRSGLDVLKALALGAKGVMLGRAWAYALGGGGEAGVSAMLATLRRELEVAMALTGCPDVRDAGPALINPRAAEPGASASGRGRPALR